MAHVPAEPSVSVTAEAVALVRRLAASASPVARRRKHTPRPRPEAVFLAMPLTTSYALEADPRTLSGFGKTVCKLYAIGLLAADSEISGAKWRWAPSAGVWYHYGMGPVEARYEQGTLKLAQPLPLTPGEEVRVIIVRKPDPERWNLEKLRSTTASEDLELAAAGLGDWERGLDGDEGSD
jgi:predicted DNA-binding antitoxin AbrB/MazE fold protein